MNRLAIRLCIGSMLVISGALLSDAQTSSVLHSFTGTATDGDAPNSLIEAQDGNYYGTTAFGGSAGSCTDSNNSTVGCGTVFKLSSGTVTVLYSFSGGADGGEPTGIIQGPDGNLYGVAAFGGSSQGNGKCLAGTVDTGCGTIFEIAPSSPPASGKLVPIYNFTGGSDGAYPNPLTMGTGGVLYGSALDCSQCSTSDAYGVLFSFSPAGASGVTPTILSTFGTSKGQNGSSFAYPNALVQASAQILYGTAQLGGDTAFTTGCLFVGSNSFGCGGVFSYNLSTTKESDLCLFGESANVSTSSSVSSAALPLVNGKGGPSPQTIVKQSSGRFPSDGAPWSFQSSPMTIAMGGDGNIYGAAPPACVSGESSSSVSYTAIPACTGATTYDAVAPATVFQCIPSSTTPTLNTVYEFGATNNNGNVIDGGGSLQGLLLASDGNYYGTSGVYTFNLTPTQMSAFTSSGTTSPLSSLSPFYSTLTSDTANFSPNSMIQGSNGSFYGTTATGGASSDGAIFEVTNSLNPPVQLSFIDSSITLGSPATLNWTVPNAYSLTAEQCYAFVQNNASGAGTWSGLQAGSLSEGAYSGSSTITPTSPGTFTYALTCGGIVSGFAMLQVNEPQAATMSTPTPGSTLSAASTTFTWNAGSGGVTGYYLWIGTSAGTANLANIGLSSSTTQATVTLPTNGATIYVQLWTQFSGGNLLSNSYTYTEDTITAATMSTPTPGSTLTAASTTFNWNAGVGGVTGYYLWIGTSVGTSNLANIGFSSSTTQATVTLPTNGAKIYVELWTAYPGGSLLSNSYTYTEDTITAATMSTPTPGNPLTAASTTFNWNAGVGGVTGYYLWIGTSVGTANLVNIGFSSSTTQATVTLPTNGAPIYVELWTKLSSGTLLSNSYTYTEFTQSAATITSPINGSTLTSASTTFTWNAGSGGVTGYYLWIGTSAGTANLANIGFSSTTTQATVTLPTNGAPIYVELWTKLSSGTLLSNSYTYTEFTQSAATITSPINGSTLTSASTTFTWNAGSGGVTGYYLWIGTSAGTANLANIGFSSTTTQATVTLPTNGAPIYVELWTQFSGGSLLSNSYTYTEFTQSAATITSPINGSTLTSASTTFTWNAGSGGVTGYYLWIGTSAGTANLANIGFSSTTTQATVILPTNGATIYVQLWTQFSGGNLLSNSYAYTEAP